jgi:hypothetical protein
MVHWPHEANVNDAPDVQVSGALFLSVAQACVNLNFFLDDDFLRWLPEVRVDGWYPLARFNQMLDVVVARYADPVPILERIGIEIATIWYGGGPGYEMIKHKTAPEFLELQTSSTGYYSMVKGDPDDIGEFVLVELDEAAGTAAIRSTTPFSKDLERGVIIGCLRLIPGLLYSNADNSADPSLLRIEFH